MVNYNDLVCFLNSIDDFFIEVEGKPNKIAEFIAQYNSTSNARITMNTEGIRVLSNDVDKWALEFRLYTNVCPNPPLGDEFHSNKRYRPEYSFRFNNNAIIKILLANGYHLGHN